MIKIQQDDFNIEDEVMKVISKNTKIGGVTTFIGYVRNINNNKEVISIELEVYEKMAYKSLEKELEQLGKFQEQLYSTTQGLENALKSSSARGKWGEMKLKNIVELAGLQKHVDFVERETAHGEDGDIDQI